MGIFFWTKILDFLGFSLACLTELCSFGYAKKFLSPGTRKVLMTSLNANFDDVISGTMHYLIAHAVLDPVRQQSRRMMGVVRGLNASMTSLSHIC